MTDPLIAINSGATGSNTKDLGMIFGRGSDTNVALLWDESTDQFAFINTDEAGLTSGDVTIASYSDLKVNDLIADNVTGATVVATTGFTGNLTGNVIGSTTGINYGNVTSTVGTSTFNNITMAGNLIVNGSTTTVSSTNTTLTDNLIELNTGAGSNDADAGIVIERGTTGDNAFMGWDESSDSFILGTTTATGSSIGNLTITPTTLQIGILEVDNTGGATPTYSHTNNGEGIILRYNDDSGARAADIVAIGNNPAGATTAMRFFVNPNSTDAASEVMRIQNGNVGINTSTPASLLEVKASALNRANGIALRGSGANDVLYMYPSADNVATIEHLINGTTDTGGVLAINPQGGNVGIGTASPSEVLHVVGNILASGDVTAYSDERLKDNIQTIDGALGKVNSMRGVTYTKDGLESSGVIAQEIEKIAPELVKDGEYKSVAYGNLVGYLIEAIKEQQIQIEQSKIEIDNLKKLIGE